MSDDPVHPGRVARNELFARVLTVPVVVLGVVAVVAAVASGRAGAVAAQVSVGVVVAAPLVRVAWLARRWWQRGDRRCASVAAGVLAIVGVGAVIAFWG